LKPPPLRMPGGALFREVVRAIFGGMRLAPRWIAPERGRGVSNPSTGADRRDKRDLTTGRITVRKVIAGLLVLTATLFASEARAQVPWESPLMVGPGSPGGLSILLADPGAGIGVFAHWMSRAERNRLGFRLGVAEEGGPNDDLAVFGGVGAGVGNNTLLSIPFGIAFGRVLTTQDVWFHPYVTPRFVVDAYMGEGSRDDLDLGFVLDLGADFAFSGSWAFRFGASVGDRDGIAVGLVIPTG